MLFAFIDTNVILHYRPLKEIDWCKVCGAKPVTIMLCMPVVDELDNKKFDARLGQRAKDRIRYLREQSKKPVRRNVTLQIHYDPHEEFGSGDINIARLVAAYRDKNGVDVAVITEDWGMQTRCDALGIQTVTPPESQRLADDETDDKKAIKKLQREILEFKNKQPNIEVTFSPPPEEIHQLRRRTLPVVTDQLAKLRDSLTPYGKYHVPSDQVEGYLGKVKTWLQNDYLIADESARTLTLGVAIKNSGHAPANGVDLTIKFPDALIGAVAYEHWIDGNRARPNINRPQQLDIFSMRLPDPSPTVPPTIWRENHSLPLSGRVSGRVFTMHFPVLAHDDERAFDKFYLTFKSWDVVKSFVADVSIRTLQPPNMQTLKIPVKVEIVERGEVQH